MRDFKVGDVVMAKSDDGEEYLSIVENVYSSAYVIRNKAGRLFVFRLRPLTAQELMLLSEGDLP